MDISISREDHNLDISSEHRNININSDASTYHLPIASETTLGGIKVGDNLTIEEDGTLNAESTEYQLPTASASTLGGVKVGNNLAINDGVLTAAVDSVLSGSSSNPVQNSVVTSNISSINSNLGQLDTRTDNLENSVSTISSTVTSQGTAITDLGNDVSALQTTVETNTTNIDTNTGNITANAQAINDLDSRLDTAEGTITNLEDASNEMSSDINILKNSTYVTKTLSIYGDSISTYVGYVPEGNAVYYDGSRCGVTDVLQTWWMEVINALQMELAVNNSWSGRAVSSCRDSDPDHTTDAGYKQTNIDVLGSNGTPDVIIIKLGINDFNHGAYLGTYDGSTALPSTVATFTDAYAVMLDRIMTTYPTAEIYCCTLMDCERNGGTGFPEISQHGESLVEWNEALKKLALAFGCKILDHAVAGITHYNLSTYCGDYDPDTQHALHPNPMGMSLIANETIHEMDNAIRTRYVAV